MIILLAVMSLALLALTAAVVWAGRVVSRTYERPAIEPDHSTTVKQLLVLAEQVDKNTHRIDDLVLAIDEGIKRVDRAESRVQKTVTSAKRLVASAGLEHAALDAEDQELHERDGDASEEEPVLPLQPHLELDGPSGIPGMSRSELKALRGA